MDELREIAGQIAGHLQNLRQFTSTSVGVSRLPFTPEAKAAAQYLAAAMEDIGLGVRCDAAGSVIGRLEGQTEETIAIGSHYDSVQHGGAFDGIAGVVCGMEIARLFVERKIKLPYSLEIVATNDEEGVRFGGGFFSSKAFLGLWAVKNFQDIKDGEGISIYQAMQSYGLVPEEIGRAKWDISKIKCFLEIHCEQGPVLEAAAREIGIVQGIVGMRRFSITIRGRADHAGTTPMTMRKDAFALAAKVIAQVETIAGKYANAVATVGACQVSPNAVNTIAETVVFSLDIRSVREEDIQAMEKEFMHFLAAVVKEKEAGYQVEKTLEVRPVIMNEALQQLLEKSCRNLGRTFQYINSGAGHDALQLGSVLPTAMVFVPSRDGRSHCPEEFTDSRDLAKAVLIVFDTINNL